VFIFGVLADYKFFGYVTTNQIRYYMPEDR